MKTLLFLIALSAACACKNDKAATAPPPNPTPAPAEDAAAAATPPAETPDASQCVTDCVARKQMEARPIEQIEASCREECAGK